MESYKEVFEKVKRMKPVPNSGGDLPFAAGSKEDKQEWCLPSYAPRNQSANDF